MSRRLALPAVWALAILLLCPVCGLRAAEAVAPAPVPANEFLTRAVEAAETGDTPTLRHLFSGTPPAPPDPASHHAYYTSLASTCLDASLWRTAIQLIQLAGVPPPGTGNRSWISALAHVQLGETAAAQRIAALYPKDSPARDYLEAVRLYFEWRELGPANPSATRLHADAQGAIVRATRDAALRHPDFSPRFHVLRCSILEAVDDPTYYANAAASRALAFPRRASFLRARLAGSWPLEPAAFAKASAAAGLSPQETGVWQRFVEVRAIDIDELPSQAAAKLAVLPDRAEFDEARLITLRLAARELTDRIGNGDPEHLALARRYAELASKLSRPADALRALRIIDARRAAAPSDTTFGPDAESDLAQLAGDTPRALARIHAQARTRSRELEWLKREVAYVQRHDTLRAAHAFLKRLSELESDNLGWKLAIADLPDRTGSVDQELADAKEKLQIAAEAVSLTPEQFNSRPETVLDSPTHRLGLYAEIFAQVPMRIVPPSRSWLNYERALASSAEMPFLEPGSAAARRRVFRELVERCYKEMPGHPVIQAQYHRITQGGAASNKPSKADAPTRASRP